MVPVLHSSQPNPHRNKKRKLYAIKQIKICAEYRDMLPRPWLDLSGTPGLIGLNPGPIFYLLSWSSSHLEFSLQVTWSFSIFSPSGEIPSNFSCWLGDILGHSNIVICIMYHFKIIYVTLYVCFTIYVQKAVRILCIDKLCSVPLALTAS